MQKIKQSLGKVKRIATEIPHRKHYIDFLAALLSIPVLLSVIILNYSNLQNNKDKTTTIVQPAPTTAPDKQTIILENPGNSVLQPQATQTQNNSASVSAPASCIKQVGPLQISSPTQNQTVSDNPVCIIIKQTDPNYCSSVWSYRINQGSWSEYTGNSPCLYNLPQGPVMFDLRIQSTVSNDQTSLERNFTYQGGTPIPTPTETLTPTPAGPATPTLTASPSATTTP